mmetsp:Transcript_16672/g.23342  ORF Transcript_16672/g.23342 Transcript_16672/m.23342 type:complete len:95 (-) Transcript_16672:382-666(-)
MKFITKPFHYSKVKQASNLETFATPRHMHIDFVLRKYLLTKRHVDIYLSAATMVGISPLSSSSSLIMIIMETMSTFCILFRKDLLLFDINVTFR